MGIDIYARWKGQTVEERNAQMTAAFSTVPLDIGYAREPSFDSPSPTKFLFQEAFESPSGRAAIPAKTLRRRLEQALDLAVERQRELYGILDERYQVEPVLQSLRRFVALCEAKERETGEPVAVVISY